MGGGLVVQNGDIWFWAKIALVVHWLFILVVQKTHKNALLNPHFAYFLVCLSPKMSVTTPTLHIKKSFENRINIYK